MNNDLKTCLIIVVTITILAEVFSVVGIATSPHIELYNILFSEHSIFLIGGITAHSFLMKLFSGASKRELSLIFLAGTIFSILYFTFNEASHLPYWYQLSVLQAGLGITSFLIIFYKSFLSKTEDEGKNRDLFMGSICIYLIALNVDCYLGLTSAIHPITYDLVAYKFDLSLGADFSSFIAVLLDAYPTLKYISSTSYILLPYGFSVLFGLYIAGNKKLPVNILYAILTSMFCAYIFYHISPAAGPAYAFGKLFPLNMPSIDTLTANFSLVTPAPRNAIPSMHFGWALIMWIISLHYNAAIRVSFGLLLVFNLMATLGLGEHYLIDLIISVPFMLFVFAFCRKQTKKYNHIAFIYGLCASILWLFYIRIGYQYFNFIPGLSWLLVIATILGSAVLFSKIYSNKNIVLEKPHYAYDRIHLDKNTFDITIILVCVIFFCSGFAALVYQVLFSKILSYTFGSHSSATYTVLSTYMGGMAIGAWLGGKVVLSKPPLKLYAFIEVLIAIYCLSTPYLFDLVQEFYAYAGSGLSPEQFELNMLRFLLGVLVLLFPTILMGMTLPVLTMYFKNKDRTYGSSIAILYSANTIGAAFGALLCGYLIIPTIGIKNTIYIAAWINILAAGIAYIYSNKEKKISLTSSNIIENVTSSNDVTKFNLFKTNSGYIAISIIGFISLALEVVYAHMLSIVAGNSIYAFSLMLFTFLIGLGAGSEFSRQIMLKNIKPTYFICLLSIILSISILSGIFVWEIIPDYFAGFEYYPLARTFGAREFIRGLVCFVCMFPAAFIIGSLYPICLQHVSDLAKDIKIKAISKAIALNTVGNILGVLVVGFLILPNLGALNSLYILALLCIFICVYFINFLSAQQKVIASSLLILCISIYLMTPDKFNYDRLSTGANVYFKTQIFGSVIDHLESLDGGLTTVHNYTFSNNKSIKTLLTNGKFQGTDSQGGEMVAQISYALVPLMHTSNRKTALVIGYGTGTTANILHKADFKNLDVVDISNDIFLMANKYFENINNKVTDRDNVTKHVTDGRNFLLLSEEQYDLISIQLSSIWFAGAASLYNKEFYSLVNKNLNNDGVLQQWVQLHHITPFDLTYIIGTLRSEFEYVWLYVVGEQGILIATNNMDNFPKEQYIQKLDMDLDIGALINDENKKAHRLLQYILLSPNSVDKMLASFIDQHGISPVSNNDNNILEYSTPKGNVLDSKESYDKNIRWLKTF